MNRNPRAVASNKSLGQGWALLTLGSSEVQLAELQEYLLVVADFLEREKQTFIQRHDEEVKRLALTGEEAEAYFERHEDDYYRLDAAFPSIVLSSVLLSTCAHFEGQLTDFCRDLQDDGKLASPVLWESGPKGTTGIRKGAWFLEANFGIHASDHPGWDALLDVYRIRDCFVHAAGRVTLVRPGRQPELRNAVKRFANEGVLIQHGRVIITSDFLHSLMMRIGTFWKALSGASRDNAVLGPRYWP